MPRFDHTHGEPKSLALFSYPRAERSFASKHTSVKRFAAHEDFRRFLDTVVVFFLTLAPGNNGEGG